MEIEKISPKFRWQKKGLEVVETILRKVTKVEGLTYLMSKIKPDSWTKMDTQISGMF